MVGYSGTPLAKKLGIKPDSVVFTFNAPKDYRALLAPLPDDVRFVTKPPQGGADIVHLFVTTLAELESTLKKARSAMKVDGALWISWYKQAAKIPTDVTEDRIRERILKTDLVDVKVAAVSEIWSGLKCVVRIELR
jgi:hypothetical protein